MPDRIVREKILTSDTVNLLTWAGECFYRRLMSVVDDYGRFDARAAILRSQCYPLKIDKVSDADIVKWLGECSKAGLISVYQVDNKDYLEVFKFGQRLRAMKSKYPGPNEGKLLSSADIRWHLSADDGHPQPEEKGRESDFEIEEKGREVKFPLAHCSIIAQNDPVWVNANKATPKEIEEFNLLLTKRGHYEKNPADYKSHFANWKISGKKESSVQNSPDFMKSSGGPKLEKL